MVALGNQEGAGKTGHRLAPMAPVQQKTHGAGTTGSAANTRPSLRDGVTVYSALSRVNGLSCHPRLASVLRDLIPASRDQDHTPSPSASMPLVARHHPRPPHPRLTFVTTRTSLLSRRDGAHCATDLGSASS